MKKKIYGIIIFIIILILIANNSYCFNTKNLVANIREKNIMEEFDYKLTNIVSEGDIELKRKIEAVAKKTTTLLLGNPKKEEESSIEYYNRYKEYQKLIYLPEIPKDENGQLDKNSKEYADQVVAGYSVPYMFSEINNYNIKYNSISDIKVSRLKDIVVATVYIPNVEMKEESKNDYTKYEIINTNIVLYYYYKLLESDYKLYYLFGDTTDTLETYSLEIEASEIKDKNNIALTHESELSNIYNFDKLNNLSNEILNSIYDSTKPYLVKINGFENTGISVSANGFFIKENLIVTTWNFIENALTKSQRIVASDYNDRIYNIEGIVTINKNSNIAILKTTENAKGYVKIGNSKDSNIEDAIIALSSKSGVGLTTYKGIVIQNDDYIQTSIPLSQVDEGSPLLNEKGEVIGINTAYSVDTDVSIAISSASLKEIQEMFNNKDKINNVSFKNLKEKYFYKNQSEEKYINNVSEKIWNEYKNVGKIEEKILLEKTKINYKNKKICVRYKNNISDSLNTLLIIQPYFNELEEEGFKKTFENNYKIIYQNNQYRVNVLIELNYVMVGIEKL